MQVASILSDLVSLRVCDHSAALALVSVYKSIPQASANEESKASLNGEDQADPDLQRAFDLVDLHYGVKVNHMQGEDAGLKQARRDVDRVLENLEQLEQLDDKNSKKRKVQGQTSEFGKGRGMVLRTAV